MFAIPTDCPLSVGSRRLKDGLMTLAILVVVVWVAEVWGPAGGLAGGPVGAFLVDVVDTNGKNVLVGGMCSRHHYLWEEVAP